MRRIFGVFLALLFVLTASGWALAGTATMDFESGTGLLSYLASGPGTLTTQGGRAYFTGPNVTLLAQGGTPISCGGTVTASMQIHPYGDAQNLVALVMYDAQDPLNRVSATCSADGIVTLEDCYGNWRNGSFAYPGASNNTMQLTYNAGTGAATLTLNGTPEATLWEALAGAGQVYVGVASGGTGGFDLFVATGDNIPNYPEELDTDGDGVSDAQEGLAGTDPHDPGSRPVSNSTGATVTGRNGASATFTRGSLPADTINAGVGAPSSIPTGAVPGGQALTGAGVDLEPSGIVFSIPVSVSLPYTSEQIPFIDESSLTAVYYTGSDYSNAGIADVAVNITSKCVTFTTTHFTTFVLVGDPLDSDNDGVPDAEDAFPHDSSCQTDSDDDGLGDEWEIRWFGNLSAANETSDYDGDGVTDRVEFRMWAIGADPTDGATNLPVGTGVLLVAGILIAGVARLSRHRQ